MKKIFNILMASLAVAALATSCLKEGEPLASNVTADKTELQPFEAQNSPAQKIQVTADGDWVAGAPSWITLSAYAGSGNAEISVSVEKNFKGEEMQAPRSGVITIGGANGTAVVNVRQRGDKGKTLVIFETVTIAQFIQKAEDKDVFYHMTGTITEEYNNFSTYGNFYMTDAAGDKILVYGLTKTKQASNDKSFASLNLKIGDQVSLAGYRTSYSGTAQVGGAYLYDPEMQNIQISPDSYESPIDTGDFVLDIISRGAYTVTPSADWIVCEEADADHQVKVHIKKNTTPAPRSGKISVKVTIPAQGETPEVTQTVECAIHQMCPEPETITSIADARALPKGSTTRIQAQVMMASSSTGYIVSDGTGNMLVYAKTSYTAGDSVKVVGATDIYNFGYQIKPYAEFDKKIGRADVAHSVLPVQVDSLALVTKTTLSGNDIVPCELIEIVGTIYKSGNYAAAKNLADKKAVNYEASLYTPKGMDLLGETYLDKRVKLTGYYTAFNSKKKQLSIYLTKAEPIQ